MEGDEWLPARKFQVPANLAGFTLKWFYKIVGVGKSFLCFCAACLAILHGLAKLLRLFSYDLKIPDTPQQTEFCFLTVYSRWSLQVPSASGTQSAWASASPTLHTLNVQARHVLCARSHEQAAALYLRHSSSATTSMQRTAA